MMNEVKQMKHIKHNFDESDTICKNDNINLTFSSSDIKEETKQNNLSFFKSTNYDNFNSNEEKEDKVLDKKIWLERDKKDENENNFCNNFIEKTCLNKINDDFLMSEKLFKKDGWTNEINNLLNITSTSSGELNNDSHDFYFENKNICFQERENENEYCIRDIKINLNTCLDLFDNNSHIDIQNKDQCSIMTNLYLNEYEKRKVLEDFIYKF